MNISKYLLNLHMYQHISSNADRCLKGFPFHYHLPGWHNCLQQDRGGTLRPHQTSFQKLMNAQLSMELHKCHFFAKEIQYLGHIPSTTGIRPLPSESQAINNIHHTKTVKQVHTFLGPVEYYRKFIKDFTRIAKPLTLLTHHKAKFDRPHHTIQH